MIEYRKEYKIIFSRRELGEIFNFYQGIETIYQPRNISSVYMDTKKFDIYRENLFNDAEKSKLRFFIYKKFKNNLSRYSIISILCFNDCWP